MTSGNAPLLIRGRRVQNTGPGLATTTNGTLISGRGNCQALDLVFTTPVIADTRATLTVGGQNVLQGIDLCVLAFNALQGQYQSTLGNYGQNQTTQVAVINGDLLQTAQGYLLEYYENRYQQPGKIAALLAAPELATKRISIGGTVPNGNSRNFDFVIPKNRGTVWAVQLVVARDVTTNPVALVGGEITVSTNGVEIMQTVPALAAASDSSRKNFFPITIEAGSTISMFVDALATTIPITAALVLYFAPDKYCSKWQK